MTVLLAAVVTSNHAMLASDDVVLMSAVQMFYKQKLNCTTRQMVILSTVLYANINI